MPEVIMGVMILAVIIALVKGLIELISQMISKMKRERKAISALFNGSYVDSRALYMYLKGTVPSIAFIKGIDVNTAIGKIRNDHGANLTDWFQHTAWNYRSNELEFNIALYMLNSGIMIEFGNDYAEILFAKKSWSEAKDLTTLLASFRAVPSADDEICWNREELRSFVAERLN